VLLPCFSAPLVHLILRRTGLFLHSRCTLLIAHPPQLHPHRPSGFRRRTALCRSYRRCFLFYDHTDGISTRPIRISHGTHRGCRHIATDFPCVLCIVMHPPRISGSHSRTENSLHFTSSGAHLSLSAAAYGRYERGYHFAEAGYARFFTGRSLMVANDGHHTRRRTFHAVSFGAFAVG